jgi:primosomal protein N'
MKFFSVIFSLYILVLSCLPCGDADECKVADSENMTISKEKHPEHQQDTEDCSPFCTCACCGSTIVYHFQGLVSMTEESPSFFPLRERIVIKNDSFASNFYGNIWQPPKI